MDKKFITLFVLRNNYSITETDYIQGLCRATDIRKKPTYLSGSNFSESVNGGDFFICTEGYSYHLSNIIHVLEQKAKAKGCTLIECKVSIA